MLLVSPDYANIALPPCRIQVLVDLVQHGLHLTRIVGGVGGLHERRDVVGAAAGAGDGGVELLRRDASETVDAARDAEEELHVRAIEAHCYPGVLAGVERGDAADDRIGKGRAWRAGGAGDAWGAVGPGGAGCAARDVEGEVQHVAGDLRGDAGGLAGIDGVDGIDLRAGDASGQEGFEEAQQLAAHFGGNERAVVGGEGHRGIWDLGFRI